MTNRYVFLTTITAVEERSRIVRARKLKDGSIETESEKTGWWILVGLSNLAFRVGAEKPAFEIGDRIKVILEKE